jgi:hypothetical protein
VSENERFDGLAVSQSMLSLHMLFCSPNTQQLIIHTLRLSTDGPIGGRICSCKATGQVVAPPVEWSTLLLCTIEKANSVINKLIIDGHISA